MAEFPRRVWRYNRTNRYDPIDLDALPELADKVLAGAVKAF